MELINRKKPRPPQRLKPPHKAFIFNMMARLFSKYRIYKMLSDPDVGAANGFDPIFPNPNTVYRYCHKVEATEGQELTKRRMEVLDNMDQERLWHGRERIKELTRIVESRKSSDSEKINALKAIRDEKGEDVDKVADAIRNSGDQYHFTLDLGSMSEDERRTIHSNTRF